MTYTREAALVGEVMARVARLQPGATLRLYDRRPGDDPEFAGRFRQLGLDVEWRGSCGYRGYLASLDDVALGLAPLSADNAFSRGKGFGKILAYLDRGVPVLCSTFGEPAAFMDRAGRPCGDPGQWADAIASLLVDPAARARMAEAGFVLFRQHLSTEAAAAGVDAVLRSVLARRAANATLA